MRKTNNCPETEKNSRHWRAVEKEVALDLDTNLSYVIPGKGLILSEPCLKMYERIEKGVLKNTEEETSWGI